MKPAAFTESSFIEAVTSNSQCRILFDFIRGMDCLRNLLDSAHTKEWESLSFYLFASVAQTGQSTLLLFADWTSTLLLFADWTVYTTSVRRLDSLRYVKFNLFCYHRACQSLEANRLK
jgi:hypothetical protein